MSLFAEARKRGTVEKRHYHGSVSMSFEMKRIMALPRRTLDLTQVEDVSPAFVRDGVDFQYWPIQSAALIEASEQDGLFGMISIGAGKTLLGLSLPTAMDSKKAVYLVMPDLKKQLEYEIEHVYSPKLHLPIDRIQIVSYTELSNRRKADVLDNSGADLIVCDEAQALKDPSSARTRRFLRFAEEHPECRFAFMSASMTKKSLRDYAHLIELALRKNSPLPKSYSDLRSWAGVFDADPKEPYKPGEFEKLAEDPNVSGDTPREVFHRRLVETPGVIATQDLRPPCALYIRGLDVKVPKKLIDMLSQVSKDWEIVDEENDYIEEFTDASERWRKLREIACGFYYVWDWPDDIIDVEWLDARRNWNREVRAKLAYARPGMDSPALLMEAAEASYQWQLAVEEWMCTKEGLKPKRPELSWDSYYWAAWREQKQKPEPPTKAVWIDDYMKRVVKAWVKKNPNRSIVWYEHKALGEMLARELKLPHFGAGANASTATEPVILCSIRSQGTGKNLQYQYDRNFFTSLLQGGSEFEQTVGRTHRNGQPSDEVWVDYLLHTGRTSLETIKRDEQYVKDTTGDDRKALYGSYVPSEVLKYK